MTDDLTHLARRHRWRTRGGSIHGVRVSRCADCGLLRLTNDVHAPYKRRAQLLSTDDGRTWQASFVPCARATCKPHLQVQGAP